MVAASGAVAHLACFDLPSHAAYTPILRHEQQLAGCALLSLVACAAYLVRTDVAVAQERMAPALGAAHCMSAGTLSSNAADVEVALRCP